MKAEDIMEARKVVRQVYLDEKIEQYIADIVFATRYPEKYGLKALTAYLCPFSRFTLTLSSG